MTLTLGNWFVGTMGDLMGVFKIWNEEFLISEGDSKSEKVIRRRFHSEARIVSIVSLRHTYDGHT